MDFDDGDWLTGLDGEERAERRQLLSRLSEEGFSEEELRRAIAEDRLALLPVDRVLGGAWSAREVEAATGLPAQMMIGMRRLLGLTQVGLDERVFSDDDIEAARSTKLFLDAGFGEEQIGDITRVLGESMARLAATITAAFLQTFLRAGDSEEDAALRFAELAEQLTPRTAPILVAGFNAHLRDSVARGVLSRQELQAGAPSDAQQMCVCFADLVGFTRMGRELQVPELGSVAGRLARLAAAEAQAPVRLIKTIGDAAMFVCPTPAPLVAVALSLLGSAHAQDLPSLRAGIACGPVTQRAGDFYGDTVNIASRVTGAARPDTVLCTAQVHDACADAFNWSVTGRHRLKGVSSAVALFRARPLPDPDGSGGDATAASGSRQRSSRRSRADR